MQFLGESLIKRPALAAEPKNNLKTCNDDNCFRVYMHKQFSQSILRVQKALLDGNCEMFGFCSFDLRNPFIILFYL